MDRGQGRKSIIWVRVYLFPSSAELRTKPLGATATNMAWWVSRNSCLPKKLIPRLGDEACIHRSAFFRLEC